MILGQSIVKITKTKRNKTETKRLQSSKSEQIQMLLEIPQQQANKTEQNDV